MKRILIAAVLALAAGAAGAFPLMFLGSSVLQRLTTADAEMLSGALDAALAAEQEGTEERWSNPASGASGNVTFRRAFQRDGLPCRSLHILITAQAITRDGVFEMCRQPDGNWVF